MKTSALVALIFTILFRIAAAILICYGALALLAAVISGGLAFFASTPNQQITGQVFSYTFAASSFAIVVAVQILAASFLGTLGFYLFKNSKRLGNLFGHDLDRPGIVEKSKAHAAKDADRPSYYASDRTP